MRKIVLLFILIMLIISVIGCKNQTKKLSVGEYIKSYDRVLDQYNKKLEELLEKVKGKDDLKLSISVNNQIKKQTEKSRSQLAKLAYPKEVARLHYGTLAWFDRIIRYQKKLNQQDKLELEGSTIPAELGKEIEALREDLEKRRGKNGAEKNAIKQKRE